MSATFLGAIDLARSAAAMGCGALRIESVSIAGDVRLDGRRELRARLGRTGDDDCSDLALVGDAYRTWGDACVERLSGEFAFGIWDAEQRRFFGARDQLGVRSLYYSSTPHRLVFGNTLTGVVRQSGAPAADLDPVAIGEFLLFDAPVDLTRTMYAAVRRVAPAHAFAATAAQPARTWRYWTMPIDEPLRLRRDDDYVDGFRERLREAVTDRLDPGGVGVFMSGGVDSTTLAATARAVGADVHAFTWAEDAVDGGAERRGATATAAHLRIELDIHDPSAAPVDWYWEHKPLHQVEPTSGAWQVDSVREYHRRISGRRRVFFHGEGPDNALYYEWRPYLSHLLRSGQIGAVAADARRYLSGLRRVPLAGAVSAVTKSTRPAPVYPGWLQRDFERDADLRERWRTAAAVAPTRHPTRPDAYASLHSPLWQVLFSAYDRERSGAPIEVRHPFLDLRVLRFMLAVPVVPWCRDKWLLRRAMQGDLPAAVLTRRKRGRRGIGRERTERRLAQQPTAMTPVLTGYVDGDALAADPLDTPADVVRLLRVKALNRWLRDAELEGV